MIEVEWDSVRVVTVVPYGDDVDGWVLAKVDGRLVLPSGEVAAGEHPGYDTVLRIPLEVAGFRRQAWFPLLVESDHLVVWSDGARYRGARPHADVEWWAGSAAEAAGLLTAQGEARWSQLVQLADRARSDLTDDDYYAANASMLEPIYLAAATPPGGSGFGGDEEDWRAARSMICDAIDADCTFLDIGCANGHLMETVVDWCAECGLAVEPYGVDISAALAAEAKRRLPEWAERIWTGNAIDWTPPDGLRFDVVHVLIDCVREPAQRALLDHLLGATVKPGGRLIVSNYVDVEDTRRRPAAILTRLGFTVGGETRPAVRSESVKAPSAWIQA